MPDARSRIHGTVAMSRALKACVIKARIFSEQLFLHLPLHFDAYGKTPFVQVATIASAQEDRNAADKELAMIKQQLNLMIRQEEDAAEVRQVRETANRLTFEKD